MKKTLLTLVLSALVQLIAHAQYQVKGQVTDEENNPIQAILEVFWADEIKSEKLITSSKGTFTLKFPTQPDKIKVAHIGYSDHWINTELNLNQTISIKLTPTTMDLEEATVIGDRFGLGSTSSSQIDLLIYQDFLQNTQSQSLGGALDKIPGVQSLNVGVGISKPMIRGLSFNRILVNDRGIKQEGQQWGADHGLEVDPHDVSRMEIIKGPAALRYGPDAMGGVLNILPAMPKTSEGLTLRTALDYQSNNAFFGQSTDLSYRKGHFFGSGRVSSSSFADYRVPADRYTYAGYVLPIVDERLKNTAGRELHFSLTSGMFFKSGSTQLTLSRFNQTAGIFTGAVGIPTSSSLEDDGDSRNISLPRQLNTHWKLLSNTKWNQSNGSLELDLGYQSNQRQEQSFPHLHGIGPTPDGNVALGLTLHTVTANLRKTKQLANSITLEYGLMTQGMVNNYEGFEFLLPAYQSAQGGLYGIINQEGERVSLNAGIRLDGIVMDIEEHLQPLYDQLEPTGEFDQRNPDITKNLLSPSFSAGFVWSANSSNLLKVNLGSGVRFPTPIELASNGIHHGNFRHEKGDPNLVTERSYQLDIGYGLLMNKFFLSFSPYLSFFQNFIYLSPSGSFSPLPGSSTLW
ncbi:TonB-dependent receptor, partial [Algoriphagus sp.]